MLSLEFDLPPAASFLWLPFFKVGLEAIDNRCGMFYTVDR